MARDNINETTENIDVIIDEPSEVIDASEISALNLGPKSESYNTPVNVPDLPVVTEDTASDQTPAPDNGEKTETPANDRVQKAAQAADAARLRRSREPGSPPGSEPGTLPGGEPGDDLMGTTVFDITTVSATDTVAENQSQVYVPGSRLQPDSLASTRSDALASTRSSSRRRRDSATSSRSSSQYSPRSSTQSSSQYASRYAITTYNRREPLSSLAQPGSYRQTDMHGTDYHIRGGGILQGRHPVAYGIICCLLALAMGLGIFGSWKLIGFLAADRVDTSTILLTTDESHAAYAGSPRLIDFLWSNADDAYNHLYENGWNVFLNDRMTSNNPDRTAVGKEIVHLPAGCGEADLAAYNATEFNSFSFTELQQRMLGSWMIDISRGDRGAYLQFVYVNLATDGLHQEMRWFLSQQGLLNDNATIVSEGTDGFGNSYIEGYTSINEDMVVYWRFISCSLDARYRGSDTRKLPDSSGYFKLRIGTWDFYGVEKSGKD